jgi:hypothetical protein
MESCDCQPASVLTEIWKPNLKMSSLSAAEKVVLHVKLDMDWHETATKTQFGIGALALCIHLGAMEKYNSNKTVMLVS